MISHLVQKNIDGRPANVYGVHMATALRFEESRPELLDVRKADAGLYELTWHAGDGVDQIAEAEAYYVVGDSELRVDIKDELPDALANVAYDAIAKIVRRNGGWA